MTVTSRAAVEGMLQAYLDRLSAGNADAIAALFDDHALLEIPFLRPNRLVGVIEIQRGHEAIFATLDSVSFEAHALQCSTTHAIAEGRLVFARTGGEPQRLEAGIVAEMRDRRLRRLSLYCDARNIRPWSDEAIL